MRDGVLFIVVVTVVICAPIGVATCLRWLFRSELTEGRR